WGKGIATEAARTVIEHGFRRLGVPAIFAAVHRDNAASLHVARKLGFLDVGEEQHHDAPHRMFVLLPDRTGSVHHIELGVTDLASTESNLGWLLAELGWVADARWPDGRSWRHGQLAVAVRTSNEHHFGEAETDEDAKEPSVHRDVLALSVGGSIRVSELTTAAVERGWQLISIDHASDADGPGHQVAQLETPDGLAIELISDDAVEEIFEGFGPGSG
ncbi:MAG TPA: GNAT family N-acetyltransferase, partial [Pseudonocardiaceae bacterium]|nr:GNAT family N-acetyltransferase [Pseudonocardiaceae bacterium]